jgi:hypothetical protein
MDKEQFICLVIFIKTLIRIMLNDEITFTNISLYSAIGIYQVLIMKRLLCDFDERYIDTLEQKIIVTLLALSVLA